MAFFGKSNCTFKRHYENDDFRRRHKSCSVSKSESEKTEVEKATNCFRFKQIVWLTLMAGLIVTAIFFTKDRIESFFRRETIIQIKDEHSNELEFPAVTICNFNRIFKKNDNIELYRHLAELRGFSDESFLRFCRRIIHQDVVSDTLSIGIPLCFIPSIPKMTLTSAKLHN